MPQCTQKGNLFWLYNKYNVTFLPRKEAYLDYIMSTMLLFCRCGKYNHEKQLTEESFLGMGYIHNGGVGMAASARAGS